MSVNASNYRWNYNCQCGNVITLSVDDMYCSVDETESTEDECGEEFHYCGSGCCQSCGKEFDENFYLPARWEW